MKILILYLFFIITCVKCNSLLSLESLELNTINNNNNNVNKNKICSNGVSTIIKQEYTTYLNQLTNIINDFEQLTSNGITISCQIDLRSVIANFTKSIDKKIKTTINIMNYAFSDVEKLMDIEIDVITAIRNGDFCAARFELLGHGKLSLPELIPNVYERNLTNAEKLLVFLNSLPKIDDTIYGYRILFDEMEKNGHLYSTVTTSIAYQVLNVFHLTRQHNEHYIYLRDNLPYSLQNFPWNVMILINNIKNNEPLFRPTSNNQIYDNRRANIFTYKLNCPRVECQWKCFPGSNGTYFNIINNRANEYLYADDNQFTFDAQRRRVFSLTIKNEQLDMGHWQFEPVEGSGYFKIKNMYWNEYLYVDDNDSFKYPTAKDYRSVFTWRLGNCEMEGCKWKVTRS